MNRVSTAIAAGALVLGAAGASFLIPSLVAAADPTASPSATTAPTATTTPGATTAPSTSSGSGSTSTTTGDCVGGSRGGPGMGADDLTAAATVLGISEADVTTALQSGQTLAQIAAAQGVDVQKLIDAMVAAETAEIQAQVTDGTITQAQADAQVANLTQHETDEVNGVRPAGGPGGGRHSGEPEAAPSTTTPSTTSTSTSS